MKHVYAFLMGSFILSGVASAMTNGKLGFETWAGVWAIFFAVGAIISLISHSTSSK